MNFLTSLALGLLKYFLSQGILKVEQVFAAAEAERIARQKDEDNAKAAVDDVRKAGDDSAKTVEENEKDAEAAFDRFNDRMRP